MFVAFQSKASVQYDLCYLPLIRFFPTREMLQNHEYSTGHPDMATPLNRSKS